MWQIHQKIHPQIIEKKKNIAQPGLGSLIGNG